jgi:predicted O-methyltransferase YrrM
MANTSIGLPPDVHDYLVAHGVREPEILKRLREETRAIPQHNMQIAPEQGAFLALLVELTGAKRCLEIGTFTGYSSLIVALAMPPDGTMVCCDVSDEWTAVARRYWAEAGVADRIDLRLAPALETLDQLLASGAANTFDFAFVDARKTEYPDYHERVVQLLRPGGLAAYDNVLWSGRVADDDVTDDDTKGLRRLNDRLAGDERVTVSMLPLADGVTLARKR